MDFDTSIGRAWNDHGDDAAGVATRWPALHALVVDEAQLVRLIALTRHVHGVHLGDWAGGREALDALRSLPGYRDDSTSGAALRCSLASLAVSADANAVPDAALPISEQIQIHAFAADNLLLHDAARSAAQLRMALALAERSALPGSGPMHRALAVTAHNVACALGDQPARTSDERALMILAAQVARRHWEQAGNWLEVERAEYRLALSWLHAGDPVQACVHAHACLNIVGANNGAALEVLFGWEALGRAARAAGDTAGHAEALRHARDAFDRLSPDDQGWCRASLDALSAEVSTPSAGS